MLTAFALGAPAHGAIFRVDVDTDHSAWTFTGGNMTLGDGSDPMFPLTLLVDDVDGPLPAIPYWTQLQASFDVAHLSSQPAGGGLFLHRYSINGGFSFIDMDGNPLLSGSVSGAILAALGGPLSWSSAASVLFDEDGPVGSTTLQWHPGRVRGYDSEPGLYRVADVRFFLADISFQGADVTLDPETYLPTTPWVCESGFRARNLQIPAPGAGTLAGACGVLALAPRRRRR
jgi:hypothetical protein